MKVLIVHQDGPSNPLTWSGTPLGAARALSSCGIELCYLGPLERKFTAAYHLRKKLWSKFRLGYLHDEWNVSNIKNFSSQLDEAIEKQQPDVVLSFGIVPMAFSKSNTPIIVWTDITFSLLAEDYLKRPCPETKWSGNVVEKSAMKRAQALVYSSRWAAQSAEDDYGVPSEKVKVWSLGSNFLPKNSSSEVDELIERRSNQVESRCELLFPAVDYQRKGGDIALQTLDRLVESGVDATLHVVGGDLPESLEGHPQIKHHGFLNKAKPEELQKLVEIFEQAHFLILPSRADCTPVVIAEAMGWGIPPVVSNVGGIPEMVQDGVTGFVVPVSESDTGVEAAQYAESIQKMIVSRKRYSEMANSAVEAANQELSWEVFGAKFVELAKDLTG